MGRALGVPHAATDPHDPISRHGGEELVVLLDGMDGATAAGVAGVSPGADWRAALVLADAALLRAKGSGRDRVALAACCLRLGHPPLDLLEQPLERRLLLGREVAADLAVEPRQARRHRRELGRGRLGDGEARAAAVLALVPREQAVLLEARHDAAHRRRVDDEALGEAHLAADALDGDRAQRAELEVGALGRLGQPPDEQPVGRPAQRADGIADAHGVRRIIPEVSRIAIR
jgi:hypothetical protein